MMLDKKLVGTRIPRRHRQNAFFSSTDAINRICGIGWRKLADTNNTRYKRNNPWRETLIPGEKYFPAVRLQNFSCTPSTPPPPPSAPPPPPSTPHLRRLLPRCYAITSFFLDVAPRTCPAHRPSPAHAAGLWPRCPCYPQPSLAMSELAPPPSTTPELLPGTASLIDCSSLRCPSPTPLLSVNWFSTRHLLNCCGKFSSLLRKLWFNDHLCVGRLPRVVTR
jgi:hypothetical protein